MAHATWFWIYILECETGRYYTGYTKNLARRFQEHSKGAVKFTRSFKPRRIAQSWKLYDEIGTALKIERFIKKQDRKTKENFIQFPEKLQQILHQKLDINLILDWYDPSQIEGESNG